MQIFSKQQWTFLSTDSESLLILKIQLISYKICCQHFKGIITEDSKSTSSFKFIGPLIVDRAFIQAGPLKGR